MPMAVMGIGHMRVIVHEVGVMVLMAVGLTRRVARLVDVLVVLVVLVHVRVRHLVVLVPVGMPLTEQGGDAERHQQHGD